MSYVHEAVPNKTAEETNHRLGILQGQIKRLYDDNGGQMRRAMHDKFNTITTAPETATYSQRMRRAERHGLDELLAMIVLMMLEVNEKVMGLINAALIGIADINHKHIRDMVLIAVAVDIDGEADGTPGKYTKRAYARETDAKLIRKRAMKQIKRSMRNGDDAEGFARQVLRVNGASRNAANTIATSETTRISTLARLDAMRAAAKKGIRFEKTWVHDERVPHPRDWHIDMNGVTIPYDDDFDVKGTPMSGPGDPRGGAENNCHCRCRLEGTIARIKEDTGRD